MDKLAKEIDALTPMETPPDMLKAMKELINDGENDVARLPEHLFINNLLPVLTDTSGNADLSTWLDIAGHGFRPIDVYDAGTGVVLFRVPSLYTHRPTKKVGDSRHSLAMMAQRASEYSTQHPALAQTFLRQQLTARQIDSQIDWDTLRQWNSILARYGYPPVANVPDKGVPVSVTAAAPTGPSPTIHSSVGPSTGALVSSDAQDDF